MSQGPNGEAPYPIVLARGGLCRSVSPLPACGVSAGAGSAITVLPCCRAAVVVASSWPLRAVGLASDLLELLLPLPL